MESELGLFPLALVLLPGERVPLHIFEPRYRELIGECLEADRAFGLILADEEGLRDVGTLTNVVEVLEELPDGRMNVVVEGSDRFRVVGLTSGRSFQTAHVEPLEDVGDPPRPEDSERAMRLFQALRELVEAEVNDPDPDSETLSFQLAARVDFGIPAKQELLGLRSERQRLALTSRLLEGAILSVRAQRERRELSARNGRPPS